jgi:hypothetical protein
MTHTTGRLSSILSSKPLYQRIILLQAPSVWGQRATQTFFFNPVYEHPDPYVIYLNGYYYILTTNLSAEISIAKAQSIVGLASSPAVGVWDTSSQGGFIHPQLHWNSSNNLWYLYYTALDGYISYVLESNSADSRGAYHVAGTLCTECYDMNTLTMPDGSLYLLGVQNYQIFIQPMANPYTISGSPTTILTVTQSWESGEVEDPWPGLAQRAVIAGIFFEPFQYRGLCSGPGKVQRQRRDESGLLDQSARASLRRHKRVGTSVWSRHIFFVFVPRWDTDVV